MSDFLDKTVLKTKDQKLLTIADMRWMSDSTGTVYPEQVEQLKRLANLVFDPTVAVISIMPDIRLVKVESPSKATDITERFPEIVKYILGENWTVQMSYNVKTNDRPNRTKPSRNRKSKSKGKVRPSAVRKHRRK